MRWEKGEGGVRLLRAGVRLGKHQGRKGGEGRRGAARVTRGVGEALVRLEGGGGGCSGQRRGGGGTAASGGKEEGVGAAAMAEGGAGQCRERDGSGQSAGGV